MNPRFGRRLVLVTLFGVAVYAVLTLTSDVRKLGALLVRFQVWTFGLALCLAFCNYLLRFLKWQYYLRRLDIGVHQPGEPFSPLPTGESFTVFLAGFSMSLTPGKAGEAFRSLLLASARGTPVARSAPIVIADRLTDLLALILLVAVGSSAFSGGGLIALAGAVMVSGVLLVVYLPSLAEFGFSLVSRIGPGARLVPKLREAYEALRVCMTPGALLWATAVSSIAWGLECTGLWVLLRGLGEQTSVSVAFFTYATATIAGAVAMLPGGLGGTELTMRTMLPALGNVSPEGAGAATFLIRLATLWFAVVVGFVALAVFRRRYERKLDASSPAATSHPE